MLELEGGGASAVLDLVGGVGVEVGVVGGEHVVENGVERVDGRVEHGTGCMGERRRRAFWLL